VSVSQVADLLKELSGGRREALDELIPIVYEDLRRIAERQIRKSGRRSLNTTGLVNEAYLRLVGHANLSLNDRGHFLSVAALTMRQIVIDFARRRRAGKRGSGQRPISIDDTEIPVFAESDWLISLDEALDRLSAVNERLTRVVEMRFFAGLNVEEVAESLCVDPRTVKRDWRKARTFLFRQLSDSADGPP
jgi:RNA polymerase sigma factor (TIGR02999 family)